MQYSSARSFSERVCWMWTKIKSSLTNRTTWSALILIMSLAGFAVVAYSTVWGAGLTDDSYYYISPANNLLAGKGFEHTPLFPPFLSLVLSAIGVFKITPLDSIRWLNAILFAINIYLIARLIFTLTKSRIFSLLGGLLALLSSTLIMDHSWAMSEPLFFAIILSGLWVFTNGYMKSGWQVPLYTGILFGLAAITRYLGIALLLTGGIYWLFEKGRNLHVRLRNAFVFSLTGILPLSLWVGRNVLLLGTAANRPFGVHLIPVQSLIVALNAALLWFIPGRFVNGKEVYWLLGSIAVVVICASYLMLLHHRRGGTIIHLNNQQKPVAFLLISILACLFILLFTRSFLDANLYIDERELSPLLVIGLVLAFSLLAWQWQKSNRFVFSLIALVSLVFAVTNVTRSIQMVQSYHEEGRGYASARNHVSETFAYLRNRPDTQVYSNGMPGIYFWTGRETLPLPPSSGLAAMKADMQRTGALLVIFDSIPVELYDVTKDELTQGLVEQIRLSEATIYRSP